MTVTLATTGCTGTDETQGPVSTAIGSGSEIDLPEPVEGSMVLEAALRGRDDRKVAELLGLPGGHEPRYLAPVGRPRPGTSCTG